MLMKKRLGFCVLFFLALNAAAQQTACTTIGTHLNELASADQQVRQEWSLLEQDPKTTASQKDALQQRWRTVDGQNLKQLKKIIAACGWPKTSEDSHSAWLLAQHADSDIAFHRKRAS
jgi:hypothetical protein